MERTGGDEDDARRSTGPEAPQPAPAQEPPAPLWSAPKNAEPPSPSGPQSPAPGPQSPRTQPPPPPPAGPQAPPSAPPGYGGPVPPGGWQQPVRPPPALPGELAGWWSRVGATLLDALILTVAVVVLVLVIVLAFAVNDVLGIVAAVVIGLAIVALYIGYGGYFMARGGERNGQTLGKQIVGIRVVRDNGQPFDIGKGILREFVVKNLLFGAVGGFFFSIPTLLDYLWPLWDDSNRCLHDMIVTTHVVRSG